MKSYALPLWLTVIATGCSDKAKSTPEEPTARPEAKAAEQTSPDKAKASGAWQPFANTPPLVGQPAPAFTLRSLAGDTVTLSAAVGQRPSVLIFGSFS